MDIIKIRMLKTVRSDLPYMIAVKPGTILCEGKEYAGTSNPHGAISGICDNGEALGVRPGEFEFIEAPEWILEKHRNIIPRHLFRVECQILETFDIYAIDQEKAEEIAAEKIKEKYENDADDFEWCISAWLIR
jgi:hypothetical protein